MTALIAVGAAVIGLAVLLIRWEGKIGKPSVDRSRAIPRGTRRRSRQEILQEFREGQVSGDNANRATEEGFLRARTELEAANV